MGSRSSGRREPRHWRGRALRTPTLSDLCRTLLIFNYGKHEKNRQEKRRRDCFFDFGVFSCLVFFLSFFLSVKGLSSLLLW